MLKKITLFTFCILLFSIISPAQYSMQNLTVYDCYGNLTDSESNPIIGTYYSHNENYTFTICPPGAITIDIFFIFFETEPTFDYLRIFDGPDTNSPLIGGPFSGINLPPSISSNGCITINFISDDNVALEGFALNWEAVISPPINPILSLPNTPSCSTNVLLIELDQNIHCDSVATALINVSGQLNQIVNATAINCVNDSTNTIELNLSPGLNESGSYSIFFQTYLKDVCDSIWIITSNYTFVINDCPLQLNIVANNDSICIGDNTDISAIVSGGDSTSYNYNWTPILPSSPGPHNVAPLITTTYYLTVNDAGPAQDQTDSITIYVLPLPVPQNDTTVCQTGPDFNLNAIPVGGYWSGNGIVSGSQGTFSPTTTGPGVYTVSYDYDGCSEIMDITVLEVNAGPDISACPNAPTFNLNTQYTTPGGIWSGCNCIQVNGNINVGATPTTINAIYTLPNGCSDTLSVIIDNITTQADDTICQRSSNYTLNFSPIGGYWSTLPTLPLQPSICSNPTAILPYSDNFELGLINWINDPLNDFNWSVNSGGTPSGGTGPSSAFQGLNYVYTEASSGNNPFKRAGIISPCLNLSEYSNPILHFWYHMYDNPGNGPNQGTLSVDVSTDNGTNWTNDVWFRNGSQANQWLEASVDLSNYNSSEVLVRLRVITGNSWQSDVAVDLLSFLGGPITPNGIFFPTVADSGLHTLIYNIQGCTDTVNIYVKPIDAGNDMEICPTQLPFNLQGMPANGIWTGSHITNPINGTFNPSMGLGIDIITYSVSGCTDTVLISVQETNILLDSIFACNDDTLIILDSILISRIPTYGTWNGNGIVSSNYPGEFNPNIVGAGNHIIYYTANSCSDSIVFSIVPQSILTDTMVCATAPDFNLNANPSGGLWGGPGIINNSTGLFSPITAGVGVHYILYESPIGCLDTTTVTVYNNPILSMNGVGGNYCYLDTNIQINVNPIGGLLTGNGINNLIFNPVLAGPGYHTITYSLGGGSCLVSIDTIVLIGDSLTINTYASDDSICMGDIVNIGVNVNGGVGSNYTFNWDNGLGSSFEHNVSPNNNTIYNVIVEDGCTEPVLATIDIFVHPSFSLNFITSVKYCYGENGFAKVNVNGSSSYSYQWNTVPIQTVDSIFEQVSKRYTVIVTDNVSGCSISDTITIPGYDDIIASFFANKEECISLLDGTFQFIDNSNININEISPASFWSFGDSSSAPYYFGTNPEHSYTDTGNYQVNLILINNGNCSDTASLSVCILPDKKIFTPNSFTPNFDKCNDEFFVKGVGSFYSFNIKIYKRWGGDIVFESDEIILTDSYSDGNLCSVQQELYDYYKMGAWDGKLGDGVEALPGVYSYIIEYKQLENSNIETLVGTVILIR